MSIVYRIQGQNFAYSLNNIDNDNSNNNNKR